MAGPITTNEAPVRGTLNDALAQGDQLPDPQVNPASGQDVPASTAELDEKRSPRETTYTVLIADQPDAGNQPMFVRVGEYTVHGGQRMARKAAIEANPEIRSSVINGDKPILVAVPNWNPVPAGITQRDPEITV